MRIPGSRLWDHTTLGVIVFNTEEKREEALPDPTPLTIQTQCAVTGVVGILRVAWINVFSFITSTGA